MLLSLVRILSAFALGLMVLGSASTQAQSRGATQFRPADITCSSLALTLKPGQHFPGAMPQTIPSDLPPGNLKVAAPLFPDAAKTRTREKQPSFGVPAVQYMKSASATYRTSAGIVTVQAWNRRTFAECGYTLSGTQQSGGPHGQSQGITETMRRGTTSIQISLSFATTPGGGTLILYVAIAITPPAYLVAGSILRVPGTASWVRIKAYDDLNAGSDTNRPWKTVNVHDPITARSLAHEINQLPKILGTWYSCPMDDGSHDSLVFHDTDGSTHTVVVHLRGCQFVVARGAPPGRLYDDPKLLPRINALLYG